VQIGTAEDWAMVSIGGNQSIGVKQDGTLWRWGGWYEVTDAGEVALPLPNPVQMGTDTDWATVTMGLGAGCAIKTNGALYCLGNDYNGLVGNGTNGTLVTEMTPVSGGGVWSSVAVGAVACGVRTDGTLWCWGPTLGPTPVRIGTQSDWAEVAGHQTDISGRRRSGSVYSILDGFIGKVQPNLLDPTGVYSALSGHCAARDDGTLWCWESFTPRGDGSGNVIMTPVRVGTESDWVSISMPYQEVFGLHTNGRVDPSLTFSTSLAPLSPVKEVTGNGENNACAIRTDGTMWCVGSGYGSFDTPAQQGSSNDWIQLAEVPESWHCAIRGPVGSQQGTLWCSWPFYSATWEQFGTDADWTALSVGDQMCGLRANGTVWCWTMQAVPGVPYWKGGVVQFAQYGSYQDWTAFASGYQFRCGLRASGQLWCGGKNDLGELGNGTHVDSATPVQVLPGTQWSSITADGGDWVCGIQVDGSLWCWGNDEYGQLGIGAPGAPRLSPQQVGSFKDWQFVGAGGGATCGIRQGQLWCWGENNMGVVTHDFERTLHAPVEVKNGPPGGYPYCPYPEDNDRDGYADCYGDCDDTNFDVSPFATEKCNGIDDNCDGQIDEGCP
jgi:hypothetical protein